VTFEENYGWTDGREDDGFCCEGSDHRPHEVEEPSADLWNNDEVQFARLIAEMEAYGVFENMHNWHGLFESMDLDADRIAEIIDRAQVSFERTCAKLTGIGLSDTMGMERSMFQDEVGS
jgi:hypothetical protein